MLLRVKDETARNWYMNEAANADRVIVLDEGKAVGIGTHEQLMQTCEVYREIYFSQYESDTEVSA